MQSNVILNNNRDYIYVENEVETDDDSFQTILTIPTKLNSVTYMKINTECFRLGGISGNPGDCGVWEKTFRVKNSYNTLSIYDIQSDYTSRDQENWDVFVQALGINVIIKVKGSNSNNLIWKIGSFIRRTK